MLFYFFTIPKKNKDHVELKCCLVEVAVRTNRLNTLPVKKKKRAMRQELGGRETIHSKVEHRNGMESNRIESNRVG